MWLMDELDKELNEETEGKGKAPIGAVILFLVLIGLFLWWFLWG